MSGPFFFLPLSSRVGPSGERQGLGVGRARNSRADGGPFFSARRARAISIVRGYTYDVHRRTYECHYVTRIRVYTYGGALLLVRHWSRAHSSRTRVPSAAAAAAAVAERRRRGYGLRSDLGKKIQKTKKNDDKFSFEKSSFSFHRARRTPSSAVNTATRATYTRDVRIPCLERRDAARPASGDSLTISPTTYERIFNHARIEV